ncbi:MAG TPA: saccharopine dehydrogenase C-terminal domain-containing protein [Puia sp.]|jgi:saccharopine dehydrogenase-like NADP-dependent oxidoreductase|nr:saccharopine dehydrogenase C-terminal domain-containing protein [Puia sp.]
MKSIVVFGAGKSATCLIDYLSKICEQRQWTLTIGDADSEALNKKLVKSPAVNAVQLNVENSTERNALIRKADLVISLLPPSLHILIALDCVTNSKNLLTASYVDDEIKKLAERIEEKKLFFLCEMGLDPGIDHMSSMRIIHRIKDAGGKISVFRSHTGGLVAPESDDNPWHYKISWNPANIVKAGAAGAVFKESGKVKKVEYKNIFKNPGIVEINPIGNYAWYPNRDSLTYIPIYGLESTHSFIRTTLRHPAYCAGWNNLVNAGLTNDELPIPSSINSISTWSKPLLPFVNPTNKYLYDQLGLFDNDPLPAGGRTSAKILQTLLEKKWMMKETDKDMILMLHEFEYEMNEQKHFLKSSLIVKGENSLRTAMAKTVGLPLGIAAKLILENKMELFGLHIPVIPEIYDPVLEELDLEGIRFHEEII